MGRDQPASPHLPRLVQDAIHLPTARHPIFADNVPSPHFPERAAFQGQRGDRGTDGGHRDFRLGHRA